MATILRCCTAALALHISLSAQGAAVYDDFNGTRVDRSKWAWTPTARFQQSGGALRLLGKGYPGHIAFAAWSGLEGDFSIELDFSGFGAGPVGSGFSFFIYDAESPVDRDALIGMGTWSQNGQAVVGVQAELVTGSQYFGNERISTASAGTLRIVRKGAAVDLLYRLGNQTGFTSLSSLSTLLTSRFVSFGMEIDDGAATGADVSCDQVRVSGKLVSGLGGVGDGCAGLGLFARGYPRLGNSSFLLFVLADGSYANRPFVAALGVPLPTPISLQAAGAAGCSLYADANLSVLISGRLDASAEGGVRLPVPNNPSLRGVGIRAQVAAETRRNSMGLGWTNGLDIRVF